MTPAPSPPPVLQPVASWPHLPANLTPITDRACVANGAQLQPTTQAPDGRSPKIPASGSRALDIAFLRQSFENERVRDAWVDVLTRYPWDCFATLTYADIVRAHEKVLRDFEHWLWEWQVQTAIERELCSATTQERYDGYGRIISKHRKLSGSWWNSYRKGRAYPVWVVGIEAQERGSLHIHALIRFSPRLPDLERRLGWELWHGSRADGGFEHGFARLEPPREQDDVAAYVAKYVTKGGEIVLSPTFNASKLDAA